MVQRRTDTQREGETEVFVGRLTVAQVLRILDRLDTDDEDIRHTLLDCVKIDEEHGYFYNELLTAFIMEDAALVIENMGYRGDDMTTIIERINTMKLGDAICDTYWMDSLDAAIDIRYTDGLGEPEPYDLDDDEEDDFERHEDDE